MGGGAEHLAKSDFSNLNLDDDEWRQLRSSVRLGGSAVGRDRASFGLRIHRAASDDYRRRSGRARGVRLVAPVVAALLLMAAACGGDDGETAAEEPMTTEETTTTDETTTTTESPWSPKEQEVIDSNEEAWDTYGEAVAPPEVEDEDPGFDRYFTGDELDMARGSVEIHSHNGTARRLPEDDPVHTEEPHSVSFDEADGVEVAYLQVCIVSNQETVVLSTGKPLPRTQGLRTTSFTRELHMVDGIWKVAERKSHGSEEGRRECVFD